MTPQLLSDLIAHFSVFGIIKWMFLLGLFLYLAFAVMIVRQVQIMNEALDDPRNGLVRTFAWAHLVLTILLIVVSFVLL